MYKKNLKNFKTINFKFSGWKPQIPRASSKKKIRTHRKKIQKRLPGKQQDGSFVYGFGNFRIEECVLSVLPRHCYSESEEKKKCISFLLIIQTLSKDAQEQFPRPFLPEEVLMVSALQPHSGSSLLRRNASHREGREQWHPGLPMLPEALCVFLLPFYSISFINQGGFLCQFPCLGYTACVSKVTDLQGGLNTPFLLLSLSHWKSLLSQWNLIQVSEGSCLGTWGSAQREPGVLQGRPSLICSSGSGTWETRAHPRGINLNPPMMCLNSASSKDYDPHPLKRGKRAAVFWLCHCTAHAKTLWITNLSLRKQPKWQAVGL